MEPRGPFPRYRHLPRHERQLRPFGRGVWSSHRRGRVEGLWTPGDLSVQDSVSHLSGPVSVDPSSWWGVGRPGPCLGVGVCLWDRTRTPVYVRRSGVHTRTYTPCPDGSSCRSVCVPVTGPHRRRRPGGKDPVAPRRETSLKGIRVPSF